MNRKTQSVLRKLKDKDGNYLWQPPAAIGERLRSWGLAWWKPGIYRISQQMPAIASAISGAVSGGGPHQRPRAARSLFRQALCAFYTTKRVGGGV